MKLLLVCCLAVNLASSVTVGRRYRGHRSAHSEHHSPGIEPLDSHVDARVGGEELLGHQQESILDAGRDYHSRHNSKSGNHGNDKDRQHGHKGASSILDSSDADFQERHGSISPKGKDRSSQGSENFLNPSGDRSEDKAEILGSSSHVSGGILDAGSDYRSRHKSIKEDGSIADNDDHKSGQDYHGSKNNQNGQIEGGTWTLPSWSKTSKFPGPKTETEWSREIESKYIYDCLGSFHTDDCNRETWYYNNYEREHHQGSAIAVVLTVIMGLLVFGMLGYAVIHWKKTA